MVDTTVKTPYASAMEYFTGTLSNVMDEYNAQRLASYDLYDDLYTNSNDNSAMLRTQEDKPVLVPTAKRVVNTICRYVARNWGFRVEPDMGTQANRNAVTSAFQSLFARERMLSQMANFKREFVRRGDAVWYVWANEAKPLGSRISIKSIDPRMYFPLTDPHDEDRVLGVELVEERILGEMQYAMRIQRWLRPQHPDHPEYNIEDPENLDEESYISYESIIVKQRGWNTPKREVLSTETEREIVEGISHLPFYHARNNYTPGNPFGTSDLSGLEGVFAGINQAISDEDLALAMSGLGQYVTDAGAPIDAETKQPVPWQIGPGSVVEIATGRKFDRLAGINSVQPSQDHIKYLEESAYGTSGINEIALGTRGAVAESGIALALRMQPIFDMADEKDLIINDVMNQMFYDIVQEWLPQYEDLDVRDVLVTSFIDTAGRVPMDRKLVWEELITGYQEGILPLEYVHKRLKDDFGYDLTPQDLQKAISEAQARAVAMDPFSARVAQELEE